MKTTPVRVTFEFEDTTTYTVTLPMAAGQVKRLRASIEAFAAGVGRAPSLLSEVSSALALLKRLWR